jgi:hypothetical protein
MAINAYTDDPGVGKGKIQHIKSLIPPAEL